MTKIEALAHFGDPDTEHAACVAAMAEALGITRHAIYMWPDEGSIPELRKLQIEKIVEARRAPPPALASGAAL